MSGQQGPNNPGRLSVLRAYRNHPSASMRELSKATGLSLTTVYYHMRNLQLDGLVNIAAVGQRKWVSPETIEKKRQGAIKDCPKNAFKPRPKKKVDADHLSECLERAVALGKANDAKANNMEDVIRHNRWPVYRHVRAQKLG